MDFPLLLGTACTFAHRNTLARSRRAIRRACACVAVPVPRARRLRAAREHGPLSGTRAEREYNVSAGRVACSPYALIIAAGKGCPRPKRHRQRWRQTPKSSLPPFLREGNATLYIALMTPPPPPPTPQASGAPPPVFYGLKFPSVIFPFLFEGGSRSSGRRAVINKVFFFEKQPQPSCNCAMLREEEGSERRTPL